MTTKLIKVMSLLLVLAMLVPMPARAAESSEEIMQPCAGTYISTATCSGTLLSGNSFEVSFYVRATGKVAQVGAYSIQIYQSYDRNSWTKVKTYYSSSTSGMMSYNATSHQGTLTYSGYVGVYYKAYINAYAGPANTGEYRGIWTNIQP